MLPGGLSPTGSPERAKTAQATIQPAPVAGFRMASDQVSASQINLVPVTQSNT